jgi:chromosomal replication initiator protein
MQQTQKVKQIEEAVSQAFAVPLSVMHDPEMRRRDVVKARQVVRYLVRQLSFLSMTQIGEQVGCHHTSVVHSCRVLNEEIGKDAQMRSIIDKLINKLLPNKLPLPRNKD